MDILDKSVMSYIIVLVPTTDVAYELDDDKVSSKRPASGSVGSSLDTGAKRVKWTIYLMTTVQYQKIHPINPLVVQPRVKYTASIF